MVFAFFKASLLAMTVQVKEKIKFNFQILELQMRLVSMCAICLCFSFSLSCIFLFFLSYCSPLPSGFFSFAFSSPPSCLYSFPLLLVSLFREDKIRCARNYMTILRFCYIGWKMHAISESHSFGEIHTDSSPTGFISFCVQGSRSFKSPF